MNGYSMKKLQIFLGILLYGEPSNSDMQAGRRRLLGLNLQFFV